MQHTLTRPPSSLAAHGGDPPFNIVIAYEDLETGKHAKQLCDFLVEKLGHDCVVTNQMWKFEVLRIPKLREIASADAADADMVVVACHGNDMPAHARDWIESWLKGPRRPLALVALFDTRGDEPELTASLRQYLAEVAAKGRMEFFSQPDGGYSLSQHPRLEPNSTSNQRALTSLAGVFHQGLPESRWSAPNQE